MLDFVKLADMLQRLDPALTRKPGEESLENALAAFSKACKLDFGAMLQDASETRWRLPALYERVNERVAQKIIEDVTVIGVDGSQIISSRHEVHDCYLLNAGIARLSYGKRTLAPLMLSEPLLIPSLEDYWELEGSKPGVEQYIALERDLYELQCATDQALAAQSELAVGDTAGGSKENEMPAVVVMFDGTLSPFMLSSMPASYRLSYLERRDECWRALEESRIPFVSYISRSRSTDVLNALRIVVCPYESPLCQEHCQTISERTLPCSSIMPMTDRALYDRLLKPGERGAIFRGSDPSVYFAYLKGSEVARLELPEWVVRDQALTRLVFDVAHTQATRGQGYPVVLFEAHNLAVVKGPERERFFELIKDRMLALGLSDVSLSLKESRKRTSFI